MTLLLRMIAIPNDNGMGSAAGIRCLASRLHNMFKFPSAQFLIPWLDCQHFTKTRKPQMPNYRIILHTILFLLLSIAAPLASAQSDEHGGRRGPPPPPREAIDACADKQENDSCSFTGRHNDVVEGSCISPPRVDTLACAPEGGPPGGPSHAGRRY